MRVYVAMLLLADTEGHCAASNDEIAMLAIAGQNADTASMSDRTVKRAKAELAASGLIRPRLTGLRSHGYDVTMPSQPGARIDPIVAAMDRLTPAHHEAPSRLQAALTHSRGHQTPHAQTPNDPLPFDVSGEVSNVLEDRLCKTVC